MKELNVRTLGNNVIGELGEVMACRLLPYTHRTKGKTIEFLDYLPFEVNQKQKKFLIENWRSIDLFRFDIDHNLEIIEVKSISRPYWKRFDPRVTITPRNFNLFTQSFKLNIPVHLLKIYWKLNWNIEYTFSKLDLNECMVSQGGEQTAFFKKKKVRAHTSKFLEK